MSQCDNCSAQFIEPDDLPPRGSEVDLAFNLLHATIITREFTGVASEEMAILVDALKLTVALFGEMVNDRRSILAINSILKDKILERLLTHPHATRVVLKADRVIHHAIVALIKNGFNVISHGSDSIRVEKMDADGLEAANSVIESHSGLRLTVKQQKK